jgi:hypothetical protein
MVPPQVLQRHGFEHVVDLVNAEGECDLGVAFDISGAFEVADAAGK